MAENISALIVDDEFQSRKLVTKMLSLYFPEINLVHEAGTVQEAVTSLKTYPPQLVFLDIQMQKENGFDLLDKLTEFNFELIFITNSFFILEFNIEHRYLYVKL